MVVRKESDVGNATYSSLGHAIGNEELSVLANARIGRMDQVTGVRIRVMSCGRVNSIYTGGGIENIPAMQANVISI